MAIHATSIPAPTVQPLLRAAGPCRVYTDADVIALTADAVDKLDVLTAETREMLDAGNSGNEPTRHLMVTHDLLPGSGEKDMAATTLLACQADTSTVGIWPRLPAPLPSLTSAFSRRRAIFGAVALAAAPVAALPALAAPSRTSALASDLNAEFKFLAQRHASVTKRCDVADEALELPQPPETLFCREDDMRVLRWHTWDVHWQTKRKWWGDDDRIQRLRDDDYDGLKTEINRRAAARRDEIVEAWDGWRAAIKAAEDSCGLTAAMDAWRVSADEYAAFRLRLIHMPTTDPDVISVKAAVVAERYDYGDGGEVYLDGAIERHLEAQDDEEALCFSVVRDLVRRLGSAA